MFKPLVWVVCGNLTHSHGNGAEGDGTREVAKLGCWLQRNINLSHGGPDFELSLREDPARGTSGVSCPAQRTCPAGAPGLSCTPEPRTPSRAAAASGPLAAHGQGWCRGLERGGWVGQQQHPLPRTGSSGRPESLRNPSIATPSGMRLAFGHWCPEGQPPGREAKCPWHIGPCGTSGHWVPFACGLDRGQPQGI